ncbi:hypothetical protein [Bdellovibrio svalbardensis]|uniref:Uncharacterized protein n=1 Tax=Bdellovibrio svalbardensis TaxID=2972972 RepID=A0ABT6DIC9_9BACT|nr:hypothetical protein [Bdellovibrio svalbardensis]MDG0816553.1 hypothetical protein [Bdellovibrio svalbardensis]
MSFNHKTLLVGALLLSLTAVAAETIYYQTSGLSNFKYYTNSDGQKIAEKTIQNYDVVHSYGDPGQLYLVDSQLNRQEYINVDGVSGSLKWKVRSGADFGNVLYEKSEVATDYGFSDLGPLMLTALDGCCASVSGYRLYDVPTGKLIISFNDFTDSEVVRHPFTLDIPNSKLGYRFIGVISGDSTRDLDFVPPESGYTNTLLLKYASRAAFLQRIQVDMQVADGYAPSILEAKLEADPTVVNSDKIEFRDGIASMWNIDGAASPSAIEGVQLRIVVNGGEDDKVIIIPVVNDRLNLEKAQIPSGVKIHTL